jgi:hypothetical protein
MPLGIFRSPELSPGGQMIERTAVRGVLFRGPELLLLASRHGDSKFPGGCVEPGESFQVALRREFRKWRANRAVLAEGVGVMRWLVREIAVLESLSERAR